jgi:hypothetical protein
MILRGIKRWTNQIVFNRSLEEKGNPEPDLSSPGIEKIIVLLDDITLKDRIETDLKNRLNVDEFYIHTLVFDDHMKSDGTMTDWIHPGDFGWFGKIKSARIRKIFTNRFDLLINYCKVDRLYMNIILLQCKAAFRAGFPHLRSEFYNLIIDCKSGDWKTFNAELHKYMDILKN